MAIARQFIMAFVLVIALISCGESNKETEIRTKLTSTKWSGTFEGETLVVTFDNQSVTIQAPKEIASFELASVFHTHGTSLAGKDSPFTYEYEVNEEINGVTVDDEIDLVISGNQINWPMWHTDDKIVFTPVAK